MTFTLSLISTERSNVKLITQNEADAQIIMKDATLFVESDELFNTFDDDFLTDDTDDFSDFGGIDVGYNPDKI